MKLNINKIQKFIASNDWVSYLFMKNDKFHKSIQFLIDNHDDLSEEVLVMMLADFCEDSKKLYEKINQIMDKIDKVKVEKGKV